MVIPLVAGQIVRYLPFAAIRAFLTNSKKHLKRVSELMLVCIIYTTFCNTFYNELDASAEEIVALIFITLGLFLVFVTLTWWSSGWGCFDFPRPDRATALFIATNKTAAVGIPLINTIYSDRKSTRLN